MLTPQFTLPIADELVVDLFAGGGGASVGIESAIGRHVDIAVNHDPEAVDLHMANHPQTRHFVSDVFEVDPLAVTDGRPVGLLWASPDCKHFSKAKGGKPVSKKIRALAWVVIKWAQAVQPRVIMLENVEEFATWGPTIPKTDGNGKALRDAGGKVVHMPCPKRKGQTFQRWLAQLRNLGYAVEWRELRACDYGAPTIRKRLFLIARRDGQPIVWPEASHGPGRKKPWRTAAECIDWTLPAHSIFMDPAEAKKIGIKRPLADATMRRIAHGVQKYVIESAEPFVVTCNHSGDEFRGQGLTEPLGTVVAGGTKHALVAAFLAKHYGGDPAPGKTGTALDRPAPTATTSDHSALVTSHMVKLRNNCHGQDHRDPVHTVTTGGHFAEVKAFLVKYYGTDQDPRLAEPLHTITTKHRFGLVTVHGETYAIADIGMRMLEPRELYRAQGFPDTYIIDRGADGKHLSKSAQVRMCGNSVCPPIATALVRANYQERQMQMEAA